MDQLKEVVEENIKLRAICAYEKIDCMYCGLPYEEMSKCYLGFPGCARADDMMSAPSEIEEKYAKKCEK